jgi:hypothetical protein
MLAKERLPAFRTPHGWAISVLQEAGAIQECEDHGWAKDRSSAPIASLNRANRAAAVSPSPRLYRSSHYVFR